MQGYSTQWDELPGKMKNSYNAYDITINEKKKPSVDRLLLICFSGARIMQHRHTWGSFCTKNYDNEVGNAYQESDEL